MPIRQALDAVRAEVEERFEAMRREMEERFGAADAGRDEVFRPLPEPSGLDMPLAEALADLEVGEREAVGLDDVGGVGVGRRGAGRDLGLADAPTVHPERQAAVVEADGVEAEPRRGVNVRARPCP